MLILNHNLWLVRGGKMKKFDDLEKKMDHAGSTASELKQFLLGIVLLGIGIYLVFQQTSVATTAYVWRIGTFGVPTGITAVPMFIGVILLFYNNKSAISWIVFVIGIAFLLITIILSVNIRFRATSLLTYVFMFGTILAGTGLLIKSLFPRKN